ncbi:MAG TPA: molybdopterin cofactor-binding domain-containing protein, partial [Pseudolabrys sp.]|nr:molybdopterin cofactor-binding domain-containing protein [Pseudolabrys sp.]
MAGLTIALHLPARANAQTSTANGAARFEPNAFVRIGTDDTVTVLSKHIEFGQGTFTGLTTIVAEELDADWSQMRAIHAPADVMLYKNFALGLQGTGGSTSIANSYEQLRRAGAAARIMLVQAAAAAWNVPAGEITVDRGVLRHATSGHQGRFGEFAVPASK